MIFPLVLSLLLLSFTHPLHAFVCQHNANTFPQLQNAAAVIVAEQTLCIDGLLTFSSSITFPLIQNRQRVFIRRAAAATYANVTATGSLNQPLFDLLPGQHVFFIEINFHNLQHFALKLEEDTVLRAIDCTFVGISGLGAIKASSASLLHISKCLFDGCGDSKQTRGGSISATATAVQIDRSEFRGMKMSSADEDQFSLGGAIYVAEDSTLTMANCTCHDAEFMGAGGCIYSQDSEVTVTDSSFYNLNSKVFADPLYQYNNFMAAIGLGAAAVIINKDATFERCTFYNNKARLAGAIFFRTMDSDFPLRDTLYIKHSTFHNHNATNGGVLTLAGSAKIETSSFVNNSVSTWILLQSATPAYGGVALTLGHPLKIADSQFISNTAQGAGGALAVADWFPGIGSVSIISRCLFEDNVGGFAGGAIIKFHASVFPNIPDHLEGSTVTLSIRNSHFLRNLAIGDNYLDFFIPVEYYRGMAGAIGISGKTNATIDNCIFDYNFAANGGSSIFSAPAALEQKPFINITNSHFRQLNGIDGLETSIIRIERRGKLLVKNSNFVKEGAGECKNWIELDVGEFVFNNCVFSGVDGATFNNRLIAARLTSIEPNLNNVTHIAFGECKFEDVTKNGEVPDILLQQVDSLLRFNTKMDIDFALAADSSDTYLFNTTSPPDFCEECMNIDPFLCNAIDYCTMSSEDQLSISSLLNLESSILGDSILSGSFVTSSASVYSVRSRESALLADTSASSGYIYSSIVQYSIRSRLSHGFISSTSAIEWQQENREIDEDSGFNIIIAAAAAGGGLLLLSLLAIILIARRRNLHKAGASDTVSVLQKRDGGSGSQRSSISSFNDTSVLPMLASKKNFAPFQVENPYESADTVQYEQIATSTTTSAPPRALETANYAFLDDSNQVTNSGAVGRRGADENQVTYSNVVGRRVSDE